MISLEEAKKLAEGKDWCSCSPDNIITKDGKKIWIGPACYIHDKEYEFLFLARRTHQIGYIRFLILKIKADFHLHDNIIALCKEEGCDGEFIADLYRDAVISLNWIYRLILRIRGKL